MWQELANILGADRYSQHSICLTNDPLMIFLFTFGDLTIWGSYMVIGIALLSKRVNTMTLSPAALVLYGSFIFLCGLSHFAHVLTLFSGIYRLEVVIIATTAAVSVVTAYVTATDVWFGDHAHKIAE